MILQAAVLAMLLQTASISGVAVDSRTSEPLANVRVSLSRTDASVGAIAQVLAGGQSQVAQTISGDILKGLVGQLDSESARAAALKALPIDDIDQVTMSPSGEVAVSYKSSPPVLTDEHGRFAFIDLDSGTYKLAFSGDSYARQDYGQRTVGGGGVPVTLTSGQAKTDIVMRMSAAAAISGRIADVTGQPLAGVPVQLFRFSYDATGQKGPLRVASTLSDDRGAYRMFHLAPGTYYLSAGNEPRRPRALDVPPGGGYLSDNQIIQSYAPAYYPGVANQNSAAAIDISSGADLRGFDMLLGVQKTYSIRGRVVDARTGQSAPSTTIILRVQTSDRANRPSGFTESSGGTFEMRNVGPGTYILSGSLSDANPTVPGPTASATVTVVNADVDVVLTLGTPGVIPGRIRVETNSGNAVPSLGLMRVDLRLPGGTPNFFYQETPRFQPGDSAAVFRIENVSAGEYRAFFVGLPAGFYIKEARFGDVDLLNEPLRFTGRDSQTLDVLISPNVGVIGGTVSDASGQPTPGARVVLIPSRNQERTDLFRPVTSDSSGRFTIPSIAPGEYILAAWDAIEPFAFFDPILIRQAEETGKVVRVPESSNQTINLTSMAGK
jgi:hypothetical protein